MLEGKTAIVVGGGRDIGRAVSVALGAAGAHVAVNYCNDEAAANATVDQISAAAGKAVACRADATRLDDMERLVATAREAFGDRVDILINVAGGLVARKTLAEMDEAFFDRVVRLNLNSVFCPVKAALPHFSEGAAIVNCSSQAARDGGGPGASAYAAGKGAVMTFTRSLAKELAPRRIRVNAVCPGMIDTSFHDTFTKAEVRENVARSTPLGREGEAREVADLIVYLASGKSSFVNGACLDINGGTLFS